MRPIHRCQSRAAPRFRTGRYAWSNVLLEVELSRVYHKMVIEVLRIRHCVEQLGVADHQCCEAVSGPVGRVLCKRVPDHGERSEQ